MLSRSLLLAENALEMQVGNHPNVGKSCMCFCLSLLGSGQLAVIPTCWQRPTLLLCPLARLRTPEVPLFIVQQTPTAPAKSIANNNKCTQIRNGSLFMDVKNAQLQADKLLVAASLPAERAHVLLAAVAPELVPDHSLSTGTLQDSSWLDAT